MPMIMRQSQYYWVLAVCFVLIAVLVRLENSTPDYAYPSAYQSDVRAQERDIQRKRISNAVSGAIGIQEERGDTVFVVVR